MAVSINEYDKITVDMINRGLKPVDARLKPNYKGPDGKPLSASTIKKLQDIKKKYYYQRGKTFNLYNKYMKREKTKRLLKGLSINSLSVEKIYQAIGKETKDNAFGAWLRESPGRLLNIVGGGLAVAGAITHIVGTGLIDGSKIATIMGQIAEALAKLNPAQLTGISLLGVGTLALAVGMTMAKIQKNKFRNATLKHEVQEAMNKETVRDNDAVLKADSSKIEVLAGQASVDADLMQHLSDVISNPNTEPKVAENAQKILNQAKTYQQQNYDRAQGSAFKNVIENLAMPGGIVKGINSKKDPKEYSEKLQNFAIYQEIQDLLNQQNSGNEEQKKEAQKKLAVLAKKGLLEELPSSVGDYVKPAKINGIEYENAKINGMTTILDLAKECKIEGFEYSVSDFNNPTVDEIHKINVQYAALCAKFDGPTGVEAAIRSIQQNQLKLEGSEMSAK